MSRAGITLLRAAVVSLVAMAPCHVCTALAAPPKIVIESPLNLGVTNNQTPSFSGQAEANGDEVTLRIYAGEIATGTVIQEFSTLLLSPGGMWFLGPTEPLKVGVYTAQARQSNLGSETGTSAPVTFHVTTAAPAAPTVTLTSPQSPSSNITPSFTGTASDITPVTVQIHAGATAKGTIVSAAAATGTGNGWASNNASPALATGQYTAVATQASSLPGNPAGRSGPVTFTVAPPAAALPHTPPVASFRWFPFIPR